MNEHYYAFRRWSRLMTLFLFLFSSTSLLAQTAYIGPAGGAWNNPTHWTNGLPASGNDAQLFGSATVSINTDLVMDFNVSSFGNITVNANVVSNNTFQSFFGSLAITAQGSLTINGTIDNRGVLNNDGTFTVSNSGTYLSDGSGNINISLDARVENNGSFSNLAIITVDGTLENTGTFNTQTTINVNANGSVKNTSGLMTNIFGANINVATDGVFQIVGGVFGNEGNLNNSGTVENFATFNTTGNGTFTNDNAFFNRTGATVYNGKQMTNNADFLNETGANWVNDFDFENNGTVDNFGSLDNNGQVVILSGTFTTHTGSTLSNDLGSTFNNAGTFIQSGTMDSEGNIRNTGDFTNNGTIGTTVNGRIDNLSNFTNNGLVNNMANVVNTATGSLINNGTISNDSGGLLSNEGTMNNTTSGLISNDFDLVNNNQLTNSGTINNGVRIFNNGTMTNIGMLTNIGDFFNNPSGTFINDNIVQNNDGGVLTNSGILDNNFNFINNDCSTLVNNGVFNNNFDLRNDGIFYQLGTFNGPSPSGAGIELSGGSSQTICQNVEALIGLDGTATIFGSTVAADALTSCTALTFTIDGQNQLVFDCADVGPQVVTFRMEDRQGNSATCSSTITVIENTPPIFSNCPTTITVEADANGTAVVNWVPPVASDNNGQPTVSSTNNPGETFALGQTTVTYSAVDCNNNVGVCAFNINVVEPSCFPGRVRDDLLALYDFSEGVGNTVQDISGVGAPLNLTISNVNNTAWLPGCGLQINQSTLVQSAGPASKIINAVKSSNEITMEAWVQAGNTSQGGPARILSISENTSVRNATLGQEGNKYVARLRTTSTSNNGMPNMVTPSNTVTTDLQHIVYTRDASGAEHFYLNGILIKTSTRTGNMSGWNDNYKFIIANELTGNRPWLGSIYLAAVYGKALSNAEVSANFNEGYCCEPVTPNPMSCSPDRVVDGLVALYEFTETNGNLVSDLSGFGQAENLTIQHPSNTTWLPECGLTINSSTVIESAGPSSKIISAVKQSNAITMEAWVAPANTSQGGPSRIATISQNTGSRNATLGQEGNRYVARLRTTSTSNNGMPNGQTSANVVQTALQHVVYTRDASGAEKIYVDGLVRYSGTRSGSMSNWDNSFKFALANELTQDRPWLGTLYLVAVYNKALNQAEVDANYAIGPCCGVDVNPNGWAFDCDDPAGNRVEMIGKGIKNDIPVSLSFNNTNSIYQVVVEVVYKGGNPGSSIQIHDAQGNSYTAFRETPVGGSSNVYVYRATLPGTSGISYTNTSNQSKAQSLLAYVFRQNQEPIIQRGQFTYISGYRDVQTLNFEIPQSDESRAIDINLPFSEITDDCRILNITATAGGVSSTATIDSPDPSLGDCCLNIVPVHLDNVPGYATDLVISIESPTGSGCNNGQSYVVAGAVCVDISCTGDNEPGTDVWLEAECAEVGSHWHVEEDDYASNESYVVFTAGNTYNSPPTDPQEWITFQVQVGQSGNYNIFGRVKATNGGNDSFWVRANNGNWVKWNSIQQSNDFIWDQVHDSDAGNTPVSFELNAGLNTIVFGYRENGTLLDKVLLSLSDEAPEDEGALAGNCEDQVDDCESDVLFVVGNVSLNVGDAAVIDRLEDMGMEIELVDDNDVQTSDAEGKDLIVISSTVSSGKVNTKFRNTAVPVVVWEAWLYDDFKMTGTGSNANFGNYGTTSQVVIEAADHPIAAGLSGNVEIFGNNQNVAWGKPGAGATVVGTLNVDDSRALVFAYESGAEMVGLAAPARRVGLYLTNNSAPNLSDNGWAIFDAAILWARNCAGGGMGLVQNDQNGTFERPVQQNLEIEEETLAFAKVQVFPNPAQDILNLDLSELAGKSVKINIFDQLSRPIHELELDQMIEEQLTIPVQDWSNGVYWLKIEAGGRIIAQEKVLILRK